MRVQIQLHTGETYVFDDARSVTQVDGYATVNGPGENELLAKIAFSQIAQLITAPSAEP